MVLANTNMIEMQKTKKNHGHGIGQFEMELIPIFIAVLGRKLGSFKFTNIASLMFSY